MGRARARARVWGVLLGVGAAGILLVEGDQERDGLPGQLQACGQSGRQSRRPIRRPRRASNDTQMKCNAPHQPRKQLGRRIETAAQGM